MDAGNSAEHNAVNCLWPIRTGQVLFDVWFVAHVAFWIVAGSSMAAFGVTLKCGLAVMVGGALAWEIFERYAEKKWPDIWKHQENWINAYVSDIGIAGAGGTWLGYCLFAMQ